MPVLALSGKMDQKEGQEHPEIRCLERYDTVLTPALSSLLLSEARNRPIKRTFRPACARYVCTVRVNDVVFRIVTDKEIENLITFLPRKKKRPRKERTV